VLRWWKEAGGAFGGAGQEEDEGWVSHATRSTPGPWAGPGLIRVTI
jgi:hypothetical protein